MLKPNRVLISEVRLYFYSDNTLEYRKVTLPSRDANGRVVKKPRPPKAPHVTPDPMVTCPVCGSTFRVGRAQCRG